MNSTRVYYLLLKSQNMLLKKKKKKERNANVDPRERILYVKKFALGFFD